MSFAWGMSFVYDPYKRFAKCKELVTGILGFLTHTSLILMKSAQTLTFMYTFSTLQLPPHTNRPGSSTLLLVLNQ